MPFTPRFQPANPYAASAFGSGAFERFDFLTGLTAASTCLSVAGKADAFLPLPLAFGAIVAGGASGLVSAAPDGGVGVAAPGDGCACAASTADATYG